MTCDCRSKIEKNMLQRFKEQASEAKNHAVILTGYGFALIDNKLTELGLMQVNATAEHPLKKGGFKEKTHKESLFFNYCPFCGAKYKDEE
jgi:hypothetical protein